MVVGRGSLIESFPLFGLKLEDYDSFLAEKLDLLLNLRENEFVHWSGKHRPALSGQGVYPRPLQNPIPIWLGRFMRHAGIFLPAPGCSDCRPRRGHHRRRDAAVPSARRSLS